MSVGRDVPHLRVIYRSHGGENSKARPAYYSKLLALASFVRAAEAVDPAPELVFVNDGSIPAPRLALMESRGEVLSVSAGSNRQSYRAVISLALDRAGAADDVVWFAEDDYLYARDALSHLAAAAATVPQADYFALYSSESLDLTTSRRQPTARPEPGAEGDPGAVVLGRVSWFRALSTTSTFGVRRGVLREDARLLRTCPFTGGDWDHTTCLVYQGYQPFAAAQLRRELGPWAALPIEQWPRSVARALMRAGINLRALRRPSRRRLLLGSDPELVSHMESLEEDPTLPPGRRAAVADWERVAADTTAWAAERGISVVPAVPGGDRGAGR